MKIVKGFVTISAYVNNTLGQVAPLGELSTWSRTYSKEKGEYQELTLPGYKLTTFKSLDDTTNLEIPVSLTLSKQIIQVIAGAVNYATSHIRPYDSLDFKNTLYADFHLKVGNIQFGPFADNGSLALPEWISWTSLDNEGAYVKIWLSDQAFQQQYDGYDIVIIPPIAPIDRFYNAYGTVVSEINARTSTQLSDLIQEAKTVNPETYIRFLDFDYVNVMNSAQRTKTTWAVLVYGKVGDNIDAIKDAIVEYVLGHSVHTKPEWEIILPDLFKRTEFVLLPRWDKISIPNLTDLSSLYSSMLNPAECIQFTKNAITFYPGSYIEDNLTIFPYDYKALTLIAINGETNSQGSNSLQAIFPDYIPVSSTTPDFSRMQIKTRNWMIFLENLLLTAETMTEYSSVPPSQRKQTRSGLLYVSAIYENVNYLVAARSNAIYQP